VSILSGKDENVQVLDFLEHGKSNEREERVAQTIGTEYYTLLEVVMREDERPKGGEKLYIGEGDRDRVEFIKARINYDELTGNAKSELKYVLDALLDENEDNIIEFFNTAPPVTPRRHAFELLPGIGKKHMQKLLEEREKEEFQSLEDLKERVPSIPDPKETVRKRIVQELKGEDVRTRLFT